MNKLLVTLLSCLTLVNSCGYTYYYGCTNGSEEDSQFKKDNKLFSVDWNMADHIRFMIRDINNLFLDTDKLSKFGEYSQEVKEITKEIEFTAIKFLQHGCYIIGFTESLQELKKQIIGLQNKIYRGLKGTYWKQRNTIEGCFINLYYLLEWCDELIETNNALYKREHKEDMRQYNYTDTTDAIYAKYKELSNKAKQNFGWFGYA